MLVNDEDDNNQWSANTELVRKNGRVSISASPKRMRPILKTITKLAKLDYVLQDAYAEYPQRHQYLRRLIEDALHDHPDEEVLRRIEEDEVYFSILKSLVLFVLFFLLSLSNYFIQPEQRFSIFRSKIKPHLKKCVPRTYCLRVDCAQLVQQWKHNMRYIYPGSSPVCFVHYY